MYSFGLLIIIMTYGSKTYGYTIVKLYYGLSIFTDHTTKYITVFCIGVHHNLDTRHRENYLPYYNDYYILITRIVYFFRGYNNILSIFFFLNKLLCNNCILSI